MLIITNGLLHEISISTLDKDIKLQYNIRGKASHGLEMLVKGVKEKCQGNFQ